MRRSAISEVKINKSLVRNTDLLGEFFKVTDGAFIHPERHLPFEPAGIRIFHSF